MTRFLRALLPEGNPEDAVALYSFNWQIVKQNGFTRNVPAVERSLKALRGEAGTSLYDAILLASRDIEDRRGRKVLVIVTDGGDTISHSDFQRAAEAAQLADAVIYPVLIVPITNDAGRNVGGENAPDHLIGPAHRRARIRGIARGGARPEFRPDSPRLADPVSAGFLSTGRPSGGGSFSHA